MVIVFYWSDAGSVFEKIITDFFRPQIMPKIKIHFNNAFMAALLLC